MIIRVVRKIKGGDHARELRERLQRVRGDSDLRQALRDEIEWMERRPDDVVEVVQADIFRDARRFLDVMTPQRIMLLDFLRGHPVQSLSELAKGLGRDYANVHGDAKALESLGVLELEKSGNRNIPRLIAERIEVVV